MPSITYKQEKLNSSKLIRTVNGMYSVYDLLEVVGGKGTGTVRQVWYRISKKHPEIVRLCKKGSFAKAGLPTPVCDRRIALKILAVLPSRTIWKYDWVDGLNAAFEALKKDEELEQWLDRAELAEWGDLAVYGELFPDSSYRFLWESEALKNYQPLGLLLRLPLSQDALQPLFDLAINNYKL